MGCERDKCTKKNYLREQLTNQSAPISNICCASSAIRDKSHDNKLGAIILLGESDDMFCQIYIFVV